MSALGQQNSEVLLLLGDSVQSPEQALRADFVEQALAADYQTDVLAVYPAFAVLFAPHEALLWFMVPAP